MAILLLDDDAVTSNQVGLPPLRMAVPLLDYDTVVSNQARLPPLRMAILLLDYDIVVWAPSSKDGYYYQY